MEDGDDWNIKNQDSRSNHCQMILLGLSFDFLFAFYLYIVNSIINKIISFLYFSEDSDSGV